MKRTFMTLLIAISSALAVNASAMEMNTVKMNDVSNSIVTVEGKVENYTNNSLVTIYTIPEGETEAKKHIDVFGVDVNGSFSYDFKFVGDSGVYEIVLKCGDEESRTEFDYTNPEELEAFIRSLRNADVEDVFEGIEKYKTSLGVDLTPFNTALEKNILAKRVYEKRADIVNALEENNMGEISKIAEKAAKEVEVVNSIKNTLIWSAVNPILEESTDVTGIDFTEYNKLTKDQKRYVDSELAGESFADADALKKEFDRLVKAAPDKNSGKGDKGGKGSGSSGGGGGSGSGNGIFMGGTNNTTIVGNTTENVNKIHFTDVSENHWAYSEIHALAEQNIISGKGDNCFDPNASIKREEFVKMIVMAFSYYDNSAESTFDDVDNNAWYYRYVASAANSGIINGISDTQFGIGNNITRQDMGVILYRIAKKHNVQFENAKTDFSDFDTVSDYAKEAVSYMSGAGIINGMENNTFNPQQQATRAQAARLIYAMMGRVEK